MKRPFLRLALILLLPVFGLSLTSCNKGKYGCCSSYGAPSGKTVVTEMPICEEVYVQKVQPVRVQTVQPVYVQKVAAPQPKVVRYQAAHTGYRPEEYGAEKPIRYWGKPKFAQRLTNYSYYGVYPPHDYSQSRANPFVWYDRSPAYDKPGVSKFSQNPPPWPNEMGALGGY